MQQQQSPSAVKPANILENALSEGSLNTFVQAVQQSDLAEILASDEPYTVFAPNDAAFQQYTPKTIQELLGDRDELMTLLAYHVAPGRFSESNLSDRARLSSLLGAEIELGYAGGLIVNDARIVQPDIECSNGILHIVDRVLIPR